jgi:hypothetical protein
MYYTILDGTACALAFCPHAGRHFLHKLLWLGYAPYCLLLKKFLYNFFCNGLIAASSPFGISVLGPACSLRAQIHPLICLFPGGLVTRGGGEKG